MAHEPTRDALIGTLLIVAVFAGIVLAGDRVSYGPGDTVILAPTGDSVLTGTWVVTEGTDAYDELDEAPAADGTNLSDGDASRATITTGVAGRATFDLENDIAYATGSRVNWVSVVLFAKHSTSSSYTSGGQTVGLRISGADYLVVNMANTSGTSYTEINPDGIATRYYVNPATSAQWTASDVDALQAYVNNPGDAESRDISFSWLGVAVNYSPLQTISEDRITAGGD